MERLRKNMKFKERKSWYASFFIHSTKYFQENNINFFFFFQSVSENLLQELNSFGDLASQQRAQLEVSQP